MSQELRKIIWLASYPKSGNTWFRVFLSNLLSETEIPASINELDSFSVASSRQLFDEYSGISASDLTPEETENLRPGVFRQIARQSGDPLFYKVHDAWRKTPEGEPLFGPDVTKAVIYFIRNPLDVAVSFAHHESKPVPAVIEEMNDPGYALCRKRDRIYSQFMQPLSDWSGHVKSWVDESGLPVMVVRYEDMLDDPFTVFGKALGFMGITKHERAIRKAIRNSEFGRLAEMEKQGGFREKPAGMKAFFREGKAEAWREHLTEENVSVLISGHESMMKRFGYLK